VAYFLVNQLCFAPAGKVNWASRVSEENSRLLQVQNPSLASEETWAHATTQAEVGGLLLATRDGLKILNTDKYWQVGVLLWTHCSNEAQHDRGIDQPGSVHTAVGQQQVQGLQCAVWQPDCHHICSTVAAALVQLFNAA
jgi:hypothetical protein